MEQKFITDNGIEIFGYRNPSLHGFYISLFLRAGSMYEGEGEGGITHFLEHILVRNVNKRHGERLYSELDARGVEFNASTYSEMVQFYTSGACKNFSFGADIISELLLPITLSCREVDAERRRIKAEIREADDKNSIASIAASEVFFGTSLALPITGSISGVAKIGITALENYRKRVFIPENIFFYVTGNYESEDIEYLKKRLSEITLSSAERESDIHTNIAPVPHNFKQRGAKTVVKNADYTMVRFSFDIDCARIPAPAVDLIYDSLLSGYDSPFFIKMSEQMGLFYDISGATERYRNIGTLSFSYEVGAKKLYEALQVSVDILRSFKESLLPEEKCMRSGYVDNAYMLYDDAREFNFTFAYDNGIMKLGYASLEERISAYKNISAEDIRRYACEIFTSSALTLAIKGNKKKIDTEKIKNILRGLGN